MAPLPSNNTSIWYFDYVTGTPANDGVEHTFQVRVSETTTTGEVMQAVTDLLTAIGPANLQTGWQVVRARFQRRETTFSFPGILPPGLSTFVGTGGDPPPTNEAIEFSFQGRSPFSGRRVDLSLYGLTVANLTTQNFRITLAGGQPAWLAGAVAALESNPDVFLAIDGSDPVWYPYVNWNYNSYWEGELRRG